MNPYATAALAADGSIVAFSTHDATGNGCGGSNAPDGNGFVSITPNQCAFAALTFNGSIAAWGHTLHGASDAPDGDGYVEIVSTQRAFAALHWNGTVAAWGDA